MTSAGAADHIEPKDSRCLSAARQILDSREGGGSEADIRSAVRAFLVAAKLAPAAELQEEANPGAGAGRVDLKTPDLLIEFKKRIGSVGGLNPNPDYVEQLDGYLRTSAATGQPQRLGVLTDGKYWLLRWPGAGAVRPQKPYAFTFSEAEHWFSLYEWLRDESQAFEGIGIAPSEDNVRNRLGPGPRFERDLAALRELYGAHRGEPTISVKRQLWRSLLAAALGVAVEEQDDLDDLFLRHTYLSVVVGLAVQAAFGIRIVEAAERDPEALLSGRVFVEATGVRGVVESDFFAWPGEVGGGAWLRSLARRIDRFDWAKAEYDVARILYESVIPADERRRLGEYYTPDWLAREIVDAAVSDPLNQRVLDPACGSGSFIFAAVRKYTAAARAAGRGSQQRLDGLLNHVFGIDVHPVAVHLARATWTFAAREALEQARGAGADVDVTVPVYLGDSLQLRTQGQDMFAKQTVTIEIEDDPESGVERNRALEFPRALVEQADWFDGLMTRLASAIEAGEDPSLALHDTEIPESGPEREMLDRTAAVLQQLHAEGRNHIWAYYARNLVRPLALARDQVDVIIGNPPWLTYNRSSAVVRSELETQSKSRYHIWAGGRYATHQDIAGLFFSRCLDLYLREGGSAAMVLPHSALQAGQYRKWRSGGWGGVKVDFGLHPPWDLERIEPNTFFPVPACVVFARKLGSDARAGRFPSNAGRWRGPAGGPFTRERVPLTDTSGKFASPYGDRARQGATIVPRALFLVNIEEPLAAVRAANTLVTSPRRSAQEKRPWKTLELSELQANSIEAEHVVDVHLGETVAPYVSLPPLKAVLPLSRKTGRLEKDEEAQYRIDLRTLGPNMRRRWRRINKFWLEHKSKNNKLDLLGQLDYMRKLSAQRSAYQIRVLYAMSGRPTAALLLNPQMIVDYTLFWIQCQTLQEAQYLIAVINSQTLEEAVRPLMAKGQFGARHVVKHLWRLPIPEYDPTIALHREIAKVGAMAAESASQVLSGVQAARTAAGKSTSSRVARSKIRAWQEASEEGQRVEALVSRLLVK